MIISILFRFMLKFDQIHNAFERTTHINSCLLMKYETCVVLLSLNRYLNGIPLV